MSDKFDSADDGAVRVSRKQLAELERDAELGRIFREMMEALAKIGKAWLDKKPRTAKDFRQAALESLMIILDRFRGARDVEPNSFGDGTSLILRRLMFELGSVAKCMPSTLLSPDNSRKNKGRASNNLWGVLAQAAAIRVHDAIIEFGGPADQAAKKVAECFHGVKINGNPVTAAKVEEWSDERGRDKTRLSLRVTEQLLELDKLIEELRWISTYERPVTSFYATTYTPSPVIGYCKAETQGFTLGGVHEYSDAERAEMLLDWFRGFIEKTACD